MSSYFGPQVALQYILEIFRTFGPGSSVLATVIISGVPANARITSTGDPRITSTGDYRVTNP